MNTKDALAALKLKPPFTFESVKKAFRAQAVLLHPDRNPDNPSATAAFQACLEAYNFLIDHPQEWASAESALPPTSSAERIQDLNDIFDDIFGFTREDRILGFETPQEILLTPVEFAYGVNKRGKFSAYQKCPTCDGRASAKNTPVAICTYCFGSGQIRSRAGGEEKQKICPKCEGRGRKIQKPCWDCNGFGRKRVSRRQEVIIGPGLKPGGVYTLHSIDLEDRKTYDFFVRLGVAPDPVFAIEKSDIVCDYPISKSIAARGGMVSVPGMWGWHSLQISPQTQAGQEYRVANQGMPLAPNGNKRGDWILKFRIVPDSKIAKEEKRHLSKLAARHPLYEKPKPWWKRLFSA